MVRYILIVYKDVDLVTSKELKRLSRLELLELLLVQTRENERLREELKKVKQENCIEKSAKSLNETAKQLDAALDKVTSINVNTVCTEDAKVPESAEADKTPDVKSRKIKDFDEFLNDIIKKF
jgi:hypothetical protein